MLISFMMMIVCVLFQPQVDTRSPQGSTIRPQYLPTISLAFIVSFWMLDTSYSADPDLEKCKRATVTSFETVTRSTTDSMASFSLTSWVKAHLSSLYESPSNATEEDFQEFFDLTFSSNAEIILNHLSITRDELRQDIRRRSFAATAASTEWKDIAEVEQNHGRKVRNSPMREECVY
jgi:hypothetical protein